MFEKEAELEQENAELKEKISDVVGCFESSSSGDDFEMAESAREVMEVLSIPCYRHGEVKSKLSEAKKIINTLLDAFASNDFFEEEELNAMAEAEKFIRRLNNGFWDGSYRLERNCTAKGGGLNAGFSIGKDFLF